VDTVLITAISEFKEEPPQDVFGHHPLLDASLQRILIDCRRRGAIARHDFLTGTKDEALLHEHIDEPRERVRYLGFRFLKCFGNPWKTSQQRLIETEIFPNQRTLAFNEEEPPRS
jgi:hypothetical protein